MANGSWRIARTRGGAHLPLIIVAVLAVALILIGKAQSSLFDRARAAVSDWMSPFLKATAEPLDGANRWFSSLGEIFVVYKENLRLKEENARLLKWHNTAQVLNDRVKRYQLLLHAVPDPALSSVTARVIGRANHPFLQTMILDAGRKAGIKPGQAVVDARGMIGRIYLTGERTAWVIPLTDLNSRIPVTIEPGGAQAIMAGDNSRMPAIETLSHGVDLAAGAQVISSGDGDILPAGLMIGVIVPHGKEYRVALFSDQTAAMDVEILDFKQPVEKPPAPGPEDLPVTAAGLPPAAPPPPPAQTPAQAPALPLLLKPVQKPSTPPPAKSNVTPGGEPADEGIE
jgi:rod shape-determining protein MreC